MIFAIEKRYLEDEIIRLNKEGYRVTSGDVDKTDEKMMKLTCEKFNLINITHEKSTEPNAIEKKKFRDKWFRSHSV